MPGYDHLETYTADGRLRASRSDPTDRPNLRGAKIDELESKTFITDTLNSADIANAVSGKVLQAQGDGTLAMAESGGFSLGNYTDVTASVSFGSIRTPDPDNFTFVICELYTLSQGGNVGAINLILNGTDRVSVQSGASAGNASGAPEVWDSHAVTFIVPPGEWYMFNNAQDPAGNNDILEVHEATIQ